MATHCKINAESDAIALGFEANEFLASIGALAQDERRGLPLAHYKIRNDPVTILVERDG